MHALLFGKKKKKKEKRTEKVQESTIICHYYFLPSPSLLAHHIFLFLSSCRKLAEPWIAIRRFVRKRSRVVCASVGLAGLCGWLFGIVPFYLGFVSLFVRVDEEG